MSTHPGYHDVVRLQTSVLSAAEKRLLVWIARRLPAWVTSDHLTLLALAAMLGVGGSYWVAATHRTGLVFAILCLAVNWFGDSLDGTVARVRGCQRPRYGYYVDHVIDAVGTLALLVGLGLSGYMTPIVSLALATAYFLLMIEIYLAAAVVKTFRMAFFKIGPTELRILLAAGTVFLWFHPTTTILGRRMLLFDVGGIVAAAALVVIFVISAARTTRALYLEEPLPKGRD
jgi:phosphatidylglycerophosphate synthase